MRTWTEKNMPDIDLSEIAFVTGHGVQRARNDIAKELLIRGCDKLLSVDSDVIIPEDALAYLTQEDSDVILCPYMNRYDSRDGWTTLYWDNGDGNMGCNEKNVLWYKDIPHLPKGRVPLKGGGAGCSFIDPKVYWKLEYPYYMWDEYPGGEVSEDIWFCRKVLEAGFRVEGDLRVRCKHIKKEVIG